MMQALFAVVTITYIRVCKIYTIVTHVGICSWSKRPTTGSTQNVKKNFQFCNKKFFKFWQLQGAFVSKATKSCCCCCCFTPIFENINFLLFLWRNFFFFLLLSLSLFGTSRHILSRHVTRSTPSSVVKEEGKNEQCDQIGRFLEALDAKLYCYSSPSIW